MNLNTVCVFWTVLLFLCVICNCTYFYFQDVYPVSQSIKWTLLLNLCVVLALDDVTDTILEARICVNIYIGIVIIHGCLLKCEYCRFKIYHFALFTLSLWYFIFFLLNSYILLVYFLVHSTILIDLLLHLYLETVLHVILFMVKSLMNSVNSLLHLIYVHCFPFVIFQRSKLSHVFHRKVPMIWCVLIWNS